MTFRQILLLSLPFIPLAAYAGPHDILIGIDEKAVWGDSAAPVIGAPGRDAVLVMDVTDPLHPKIRASLPLSNSVFGPPTNLQITPNGRLALVADSIVDTQQPGGNWTAGPTDKLHVIDLDATPPALVETITVGRQPSGLAINAAGTLALVANRASKSVSVLTIQGTTVKQVAEVPMGEEVVAVAITPDGKRAFVAKNQSAKVAVLTIDGTTVTTDKAQDIPVGLGVYNLDTTPDGHYVIAANTGTAGDGSSKTLSTIDATANPPRTIDTTSVGDGPEGLAISPDGKWVGVPLLLGSTAGHKAWSYTKDGVTTLMSLDAAGHMALAATLPTGAIPEGIAWSPDSTVLYVGNYGDRNLSIYQVQNGKLIAAGERMSLPGQPGSLRGLAR
jgi:DNA-binding beta-propeller fold protein YncE